MLDKHELIREAIKASQMSYSPYSQFAVGAALLLGDGEVIRGCNIENASYGLSNCAERTAIFKAVSEGKRDFVGLAIAAGEGRPTAPCGACRQVIMEFLPKDTPVYYANILGEYIETTVDALLPGAFSREDLNL